MVKTKLQRQQEVQWLPNLAEREINQQSLDDFKSEAIVYDTTMEDMCPTFVKKQNKQKPKKKNHQQRILM